MMRMILGMKEFLAVLRYSKLLFLHDEKKH